MTIFITGATGTIGSQVAQALLDAGASVRVGVRDPATAAALKAKGAQVVRFDFDDPQTYAAAFAGVERMFLLSPFVEEFVDFVERAAVAAKAAGVQFIARLSAFGADAQSADRLSQQHGRAENAVKATGVAWTVIRPMFFADNVFNYQATTLASGAFYGAAKGGRVTYVSSADIAAVAAKALLDPREHTGQTYTLTGPAALTDTEVAGVLANVAGRPIEYVDLPAEQLLAAQLAAGAPQWLAEHLVALEGVKAAGWAAESTSTVEDILGRPPEAFETFAQRHAGRLR